MYKFCQGLLFVILISSLSGCLAPNTNSDTTALSSNATILTEHPVYIETQLLLGNVSIDSVFLELYTDTTLVEQIAIKLQTVDQGQSIFSFSTISTGINTLHYTCYRSAKLIGSNSEDFTIEHDTLFVSTIDLYPLIFSAGQDTTISEGNKYTITPVMSDDSPKIDFYYEVNNSGDVSNNPTIHFPTEGSYSIVVRMEDGYHTLVDTINVFVESTLVITKSVESSNSLSNDSPSAITSSISSSSINSFIPTSNNSNESSNVNQSSSSYQSSQINISSFHKSSQINISSFHKSSQVNIITKQYTVSFQTSVPQVLPVEIISEGSIIISPAQLLKANYTFDGWYSDAAYNTQWDFENDSIYANTILYAKWVENAKFTVTYNGNGQDSGSVPFGEATYYIGTNISVAPNSGNLFNEGHTLLGWNTDVNGAGDSYSMNGTDSIHNIQSTITLFAQWSINSYNLIIKNGLDSSTLDSISIDHFSSHTLSTPPNAPTGYMFSNWSEVTTNNCTITDSTTPTPSISCTNNATIIANYQHSNGAFFDERDSTIYNWVAIGEQIWMAENLKYGDNQIATCYNDIDSLCQNGKFYVRSTGFDGDYYSSSNPSGIKGLCPIGWHIPSIAEWEELTSFIINDTGDSLAGLHIKSNTSWIANDGLDTYGFNAKASGYFFSGGMAGKYYPPEYQALEADAMWWVTDSIPTSAKSSFYHLQGSNNAFYWKVDSFNYRLTIRCVHD